MENEVPVVFDCAGEQLLGIVHPGNTDSACGVVMLVGGPQYRVGSHRQFLLMARQFAEAGIPVLRFDYRGMGDSTGEQPTFNNIEQDIRAAIDCLMSTQPSVRHVSLLGLCDGASAIMMFGNSDKRVDRMMIINPWVRTGPGLGKSKLWHYYLPRLVQRTFWRKVFVGEFSLKRSLRSLVGSARDTKWQASQGLSQDSDSRDPFVEKMLYGLEDFDHEVLLLLSGKDLVAREFRDLCKVDRRWGKVIRGASIAKMELSNADHTMSERPDLVRAVAKCIEWLQKEYTNGFPAS